jgi:hypothetical protein
MLMILLIDVEDVAAAPTSSSISYPSQPVNPL